ncbi:MAG: LPS assembly lipoprotein LptE [Pseudomonadota bacterium]
MVLTRRAFLAAVPALSACGFTPVYGPDGPARDLRGTIAVDDPRDEAGFALVRALEDRLGLPTAPIYGLSADIFVDEDELGITPADQITRVNVLGAVNYRLVELATGTQATGGRATGFTSYSATGTPVSTRSARRDARERLMVILADRIVSELLATSPDWRA